MNITQIVSTRSTCLKKKIGAILVKNTMIISSGYNGAPKRIKHCTNDPDLPETCLRLKETKSLALEETCRAVHAEANAIIQAAVNGVSTKESSIYCLYFPCMMCAKLIIQAEIREIIFLTEHDMENERKINMLRDANVELFKFTYTDGRIKYE